MLPQVFSMALITGALLTGIMGRTLAAEHPLAIDRAESRVEIAVKATVDSFTAKLTQFEPLIVLSDDGRVSSARFAFHFRDIETGKDARNKAMHKWQQTDAFPDGVFVLTSLEPAGGNTPTAFGRLTLHGVTQEIQFPVSLTRDGSRYAIDGEATVDTRTFSLPVIRMLGLLKVDPVVRIRFHLQGQMEAIATAIHIQR
jgi:polyisoprenoid-binding protein YceI